MEVEDMRGNPGATDLSDIEAQFELEMDNLESLDQETPYEEFEEELEDEPRQEYGYEATDLPERFAGLAAREFESESELNDALNEIFDEMEREYFFGALKGVARKLKSAAPKLLKTALAGAPGLSALTGILASKNLRGLLMNLAKTGLSSHPALAALMPLAAPAMKSLGFKEAEYPEENREAWESFVTMSESAYEYLANNLSDEANEPMEAARLATNAVRHGLNRARGFAPRGGRRRSPVSTRVIHLRARPGRRIVIELV
jgi:hypothetical protein